MDNYIYIWNNRKSKRVVLNFDINQNTDVMYTESYNPLCVDFEGNNSFFSYLPMNHIAERIAMNLLHLNMVV